jgi:iron complex outermembrane receptor protein
VINQPLIDDTLLARVGGVYFARDGFTKDVVNGKDYDSKGYWSGRVGLTWKPTDAVENYFLGYYTRSHDNGTATVIKQLNREQLNLAVPSGVAPPALAALLAQLPDTSPLGIGCVLLDVYGPSTNCGQDILDEQAARGNRKVALSGDPTDELRTGGLIDNFSYELTDDMRLRNIVSYSKFKHHYRLDIDGSRAELVDFNNPDNLPSSDLDTFTEELQLQGTTLDGDLQYVSGLYYERTNALGNITGSELLFNESEQTYTQKKRSLAPFAQGTYDLSALSDSLSGLSLTAGARYTFDRTKGAATFDQFIVGPAATDDLVRINISSLEHAATAKSSALTYTVGLDYKFDTTLLYGKVSRGYKTGGFSTIAVSPQFFTFRPEYVTNYEIGEKTDFEIFDMPVRLNSALYYTDYSDLQRAIVDSYSDPDAPSLQPEIGTATINVGKAYVEGFETDATIRLTQDLTLVGTYSYGKGKYQEFFDPLRRRDPAEGLQRTAA